MPETIAQLDDAALWHLRSENRRHLIDFVHQRIARQNCGRDAVAMNPAVCGGLLDPNVLTLGFARRFTEYKRPNLLLHERERLLRLLCDRDHPVQLVIAGKAHPNDATGKQLLREWYEFLQHPALINRAVFIEDYDLNVAAHLVQGVDVWINTPRRPWEACGTSGMKVLVNGGLNLSELDGWWAHAYRADAGWSIGNGHNETDSAATDRNEALQLYALLENEIVPCFYQRDEHGMPRAWIARIRASMMHYTGEYSSNRMAREYMNRYYAPLATSYRARSDFTNASAIAAWQQQLAQYWSRMYFGSVDWRDAGAQRQCAAQLYFGELPADWLRVELVADASAAHPAECVALTRSHALQDAHNAYVYATTISATRPATDYTLRIVPAHPAVSVPLEENHILWYR